MMQPSRPFPGAFNAPMPSPLTRAAGNLPNALAPLPQPGGAVPLPNSAAQPPQGQGGKKPFANLFEGFGQGDALFGLLHTQDPASDGPRYKVFPNAPGPKPNQFPMDLFMGPSTYTGFFKNGRQQTLPTQQYGYGNAGGYNFENSRHGTAVDQRNWGTDVWQDWRADTFNQIRDWRQQQNWDRAQAAKEPKPNTLQQPQSIQGAGGPMGTPPATAGPMHPPASPFPGGYPIDLGAAPPRGVPPGGYPPTQAVSVNGPHGPNTGQGTATQQRESPLARMLAMLGGK